jgi:tetratricopeptide (TPR) repeat protein
MALVNIHHFLLDGAIWKLRDSRVASLLINPGEAAPSAQAKTSRSARSKSAPSAQQGAIRRLVSAPAFRVAVIGLLFLWGAADQIHFALGTSSQNLPSLLRAAAMNPYDSTVLTRVGSAEESIGHADEAVAALTRAAALNPHNATLQHACARAMIASGRYADAYELYKRMLVIFPRDSDALINYGVLAARLGHPDEAIDAWQKAAEVDPNLGTAHLYLAEAADQNGEFASAAREWHSYLDLAALNANSDPESAPQQRIPAAIHLADDEAHLNQTKAALADYSSAVSLAEAAGNAKLQSIALAHLADIQEKTGDAPAAAASYQRGLALDIQAGDSQGEAFDWFNYGQFLRRHGLSDGLAYACLLRAEELLASTKGPELETVQAARREMEARLGNKIGEAHKNLPKLLAGAETLPGSSFR